MKLTAKELQLDVDFLLVRSMKAGSCSFSDVRDTGTSSNALVYFAYTGERPTAWPADESDYKACSLAVGGLPEHRQTTAVYEMLGFAHKKIFKGWGEE